MQDLATEMPQPPKTGKIKKRRGLLIVSLIFLIVLLTGVAIYFIIRASHPTPKPEWWMNDICFRVLNWTVRS